MIHRMGCTLAYRGCGESLEGVHPSMLQRMGCTPFYRGFGGSLEGVDDLIITAWGLHPSKGAAVTHWRVFTPQ